MHTPLRMPSVPVSLGVVKNTSVAAFRGTSQEHASESHEQRYSRAAPGITRHNTRGQAEASLCTSSGQEHAPHEAASQQGGARDQLRGEPWSNARGRRLEQGEEEEAVRGISSTVAGGHIHLTVARQGPAPRGSV